MDSDTRATTALTHAEHEALAMLLDELEGTNTEHEIWVVIIDHDDVREAMVAGLRKCIGGEPCPV